MQEIKYIKINEIKPDPNNPRQIKDEQFKKLCESIKNNKEFFETRPILVDKTMTIFAGNMRYRAAIEIGLEEVPVAIMDVTDEKRKEILLRDNIQNGEWDYDILANEYDMNFLDDLGLDIAFKYENTVENLGDLSGVDDVDIKGTVKGEENDYILFKFTKKDEHNEAIKLLNAKSKNMDGSVLLKLLKNEPKI